MGLLQKGNTPSGLEVPSWLRYPPSNRCGFPSRNMTSLVLLSFTGSASKNVATPPPFFDSCVLKKRIFHSNYLHFWINYHSCKMSLPFFEPKLPPSCPCRVDEKLKTLLLFGFTIGNFPVNLSKFFFQKKKKKKKKKS